MEGRAGELLVALGRAPGDAPDRHSVRVWLALGRHAERVGGRDLSTRVGGPERSYSTSSWIEVYTSQLWGAPLAGPRFSSEGELHDDDHSLRASSARDALTLSPRSATVPARPRPQPVRLKVVGAGCAKQSGSAEMPSEVQCYFRAD